MANILAWFDLRMGYSFYPILRYFLKINRTSHSESKAEQL